MVYCRHQLGFIMTYLGHDIRLIEKSPSWYILYTSIPVLEKIGLDEITQYILYCNNVTLAELSKAYDEIVSLNFEDMFNHVFIAIP